MGEAIETTQSLYPGLLEQNPNLLFILKCRQFVEMVNGTDSEVRPIKVSNSRSNSPSMSPNYSAFIPRPASNVSSCNSPVVSSSSPSRSHSPGSQFIAPKSSNMPVTVENNNVTVTLSSIEEMNAANRVMNGDMLKGSSAISGSTNLIHPDADVEMENLDTVNDNAESSRTIYAPNGTVMTSSSFHNGEDDYDKSGGDMGKFFSIIFSRSNI